MDCHMPIYLDFLFLVDFSLIFVKWALVLDACCSKSKHPKGEPSMWSTKILSGLGSFRFWGAGEASSALQ